MENNRVLHYIDWARENSSNLFYGAAAVMGIALLSYHFLVKGSNSNLAFKNDAVFVQQLIEGKTSRELDPYISRVFKRVGGLTGYYEDFSKTSILIKNKDYQAALEAAKKLKQTLGPNHASFLYAYNLLRIASLEKEVGSPQEELRAIEDLQNSAQSYSFLEKSFKDQSISISEYLQERKKLLKIALK